MQPKIENRQTVTITAKGYKIIFASRKDLPTTNATEESSKIVNDFFDMFDVNGIFQVTEEPIKSVPTEKLKERAKHEYVTKAMLKTTWSNVRISLSDEFRPADFLKAVKKVSNENISYKQIHRQLDRLADMKLIITVEEHKLYKKNPDITPDPKGVAKELLDNRKNQIETTR